MRWDSRHDQGQTGKDRGRWVGDAVPAQRTGVRCAPRRADPPALAGGLQQSQPHYRTLHHVVCGEDDGGGVMVAMTDEGVQ